ncbi:hypothetical protein, partial [Pedobacter sp. KBW01]|uniref:A1S_2505 family phage non-structural protein n=1 Tax=Pedobacter sp. KBW01 TaxID=2153364 RepID=UPI0018F66942
MSQKITPNNITKLKKKEVFVFGSNMNGEHIGGAARLALDEFGAINGQAKGLQGSTYAIPTLNYNMQKIALPDLATFVQEFIEFAKNETKFNFLVTEIGCGIAGFTHAEIAPIFKNALGIKNIYLPQAFVDVISAPVLTPGFKGFGLDMKCRDFQYEFGKSYEMDGKPEACAKGFHYCEHPLDVFNYYPPACSRFAEVTGEGETSKETGGDSKVAVSKIHIGAEISIASLTKAAVKFVFDRAKYSETPTDKATGYQG